MFWPCIYTTLTTMVAFGSLIITDIKPIIDFGFIMLIALTISFICSFSILPLFIYILSNNNSLKQNNILLKINFLIIAKNHAKKITFISLIFFIIAIYGTSKLNVENSFINYFSKKTEIYKGMKLIDENLGGTTPLEVILKFPESKKQFPKCNLLTFPATKICKHIINNEICGYIFKKCKYTNKKKVSNKKKLGDDYLYEIKIDNSYMGNIKLDDKYIDEIKLDNKYLDENCNETRLDNKFIDEIKSIRKQLFKEIWKDNTFNNLSDIESL